MKAVTMLETIRSLLGTPACAIPLSSCRPAKTYLLERAGIPPEGTAILFAIPYIMTADARVLPPARNLSLYAVPRDYHGYVSSLSASLLPALKHAFPHHRFALFADHSPIGEVDAAARAGLGVLGDNGLLITPAYGSFVFLAEIITDADYITVTGEPQPAFPAPPPRCEGCGACAKACPTNALSTCDRSGCLSALTQKKGALTTAEETAICDGGLAWGCDACQLACPHNRAVIARGADTPLPYFREARRIFLTAAAVRAMSDEEFSERAYAWRGRGVITRNVDMMESASEHTLTSSKERSST